MASSSSKRRRSYDVFLSFRGTDIRKGFLGHIYETLTENGFNTYRDTEELRMGEQIPSALMKAIEESRIAIVVFSKDYASSAWCLDELAKIMECKDQNDLIVIPMFYKVDPKEVRTPRDQQSYAQAMAKQVVKFEKEPEKVMRWKEALFNAGNLSGVHVTDDTCEAWVIRHIVQEISTLWNRTPLQVPKYLVRIDSRVEELKARLNLQSKDSVLVVGLWGQGGVGKSTLAKAIYNTVFREFQGSSFLEHVKENSEDLVPLQKQLLSDVLPNEISTSFGVSRGSQLIQERLANKRLLIILDDVDDEGQLNALVGDCKWLREGSRVIITTRNKGLLKSHEAWYVHEVKALVATEASELLRMHAFPRNQEIKIRSDVVDSVLKYAQGIPLALEVVGSSLCNARKEEWESTLRKLAQSPTKKINDVLRVGFDKLDKNEKEIFLDIACFFKGWRTLDIMKILNGCGFDVAIGIEVLIESSLIREEGDTLQMHDLIQLMGKDIVQETSHNPVQQSRLWLYRDVCNVLSRDAVTYEVKAIVLKLQEPEEMEIDPHAFKNMKELRLLILHNVRNSSQVSIYLPNKLRWLEWPRCASTLRFSPGRKELVGLDLRESKIGRVEEQFEDFKKLKFVNLSGCQWLVHMPNLSFATDLEELNLSGCKNLEHVHKSVIPLGKLRSLNLSGCSRLLSLSGVPQSENLECLTLANCSKLQRFPFIPKCLRKLDLQGTSIVELPASVGNLVYLEYLNLNYCKELSVLPSSIYRLQNLEKLELQGCSKLIKFPKKEEIESDPHMKTGFPKLTFLDLEDCNLSEVEFLKNPSCFPSLTELHLAKNNFTSLPACRHLCKLRWLNVGQRSQLQEIREIPRRLKTIKADDCKSPSKIASDIGDVDIISFRSCHELVSNVPTICDLFKFEEVRTKDESKEEEVLTGNSYGKSPHAATEYLVGIDKQVKDMMDLLDLEVSDVRIVGIWGKGGVGKTTLAKVIYEQISSRFDSCSFLADIAATMKQLGGVRFLQSKLMSDILKQEYQVDHVAKGVDFFREVLRNMKVLIVLDNVEVRSHLHEIVGEKLDGFGYGSRIIVTTSIPILPEFLSRGSAHLYEINTMDDDQALDLFRKHALRRNLPISAFDEAARDIINSVNGIPLLIEIIGSLLDRKLVEKLIARDEPILEFGLRIQDILRLSFEELSEVQREIFLDVACLPADVDCRIASFMWPNPHFPTSNGVHALHVKSLVKIGRNNELGMHGLLREFGQQIIRAEDHKDPGRRGRLCNLELAWNTEKLEGTDRLNAEYFKSMPNIRFLILDHANVIGDFANVFWNLKWLQWQGCTGDFQATNFHVEKLVILDLSWSKVTEDWGGWREIKMPQLKVLNLTGCADLLISPDLSSFPDLEILILERCSQLIKLHPSIGHLNYITSLNLRFCNELNMLPIELGYLKALTELLIDGTSVQEIPVSMGHMEQLEIFSASNCLQLSHLPDSLEGLTAISVLLLEHAKITQIPDSIGNLVKLQHLSLKDCRWIGSLPDSVRKLERLEQLDITGTGISKLPDSVTCLRSLKVLKMDFCFIRELPREIGNLANLEELHASYCSSLKGAIPPTIKSLDHLRILRLRHSSISGLPSEVINLSCLQTLDLLQCNKIQALPKLPSSLTCLRVSSERMKALPNLNGLPKLEEICLGDTDPKEPICASTWKKPRSNLRDTLVVPLGLPELKILELSHSKITGLPLRHGSLSCTHLKKLVLSGAYLQVVSELPLSLSVLSIQRCLSLKGLPAVGHLRTLSELNLIQSAVEEIKELEGLIALKVLNISYCEIRNLNGLGQLRALRSLILSDCDSLDKLPDISNLKMLNVLEVRRCGKIHDIEGLIGLTSLEVLHVSECKAENAQQVQDALKLVMARSRNS